MKSKEDTQTDVEPQNLSGESAAKRIKIRHATEEDYRKRQNWTVGSFHRFAPNPKAEKPEQGREKVNPPQHDGQNDKSTT